MNRPVNLDELLEGCLNGTLDEAGQQELAQILQESSAARQSLRSYLQIEGGLLTLAQAGNLGASAGSPPVQLINNAAIAVPTADKNIANLSKLAKHSRTRLAVAVVVGILLVVAGSAYWRFGNQTKPPSPDVLGHNERRVVAHIRELEGQVDVVSARGETRAAVLEQVLLAGDSLRTGVGNSAAVIEFADKTRLELGPESAIRLPEDGTRSVQFIKGVLHGSEVALEQPPFVVMTTSHQFRVEGDRFGISSISPESFRMDMEAGKASVVRQSDQKSLAVNSGSTVQLQSDSQDMTAGPAPRYVAEPKRILDFPGAWAVFFEPDGEHVLTASYREIRRFGPGSKPDTTLISIDKHQGRIAAFSRNGKTIGVYRGLAKDDPVIIWDVGAKQQLAKIEARITDRLFTLAPNGAWFATVDREESPTLCRIWDVELGTRRCSVQTGGKIECLAASSDGTSLAVGLVDLAIRDRNKIVLVDAATGKELGVLPTKTMPLTALAFSPDDRYLAAGITGQIQIWDVEKRELVRTIRGFERVLLALAYSPDGALIAAGTQDGQVWIWDSHSGHEVQVIKAGTSGVRVLAFSPDGRLLATGGIKGHPLMIWDVLSRPEKQPDPKIPDKT